VTPRRVALLATAAAAIGVAFWRRGEGVPPPGVPADDPPGWEPPALAALARWAPPPPASPHGRLAGYLWALPLTVVGLAAGATAGVRPRLRQGVVLFAPARGLPGTVLKRWRYTAGAIGHVVISRIEPTPALLAHELTHVRHAERLGPLLAPVYLALLAVYGYRRHPLERAARAAARNATG
jgi:hypothetical protein